MKRIITLAGLAILILLLAAGASSIRLGQPNQLTFTSDSAPVAPWALAGGLGIILVVAGWAVYVVRRRLPWSYLGLGALGWVVAVGLKFAWAIPLNDPINNALNAALPARLAGPVFWVYVGLLTGVFEVALIWLILRYTPLGKADWPHALAFGIGFGAVEALLLGLSSLLSVSAALLAPSAFPADTLQQVAKLNNLLFAAAPVSERFFTILLHVCANVLIFYAIAQRQVRWFWLAFAYKTLIDAFAAFVQIQGLTSDLGSLWLVEAVIAVFGVAGWLGLRWLQQHYAAPPATTTPHAPVPPVPRLLDHLAGHRA